jgi:ribosomal protein S18 acetylase RimI-like enzyme
MSSKLYKELYVFDRHHPIKAVIRNYRESDISALIHIQEESFPPPFSSELWWNEEQLRSHIALFPEGALCVEAGEQLIASMTGLIVKLDPNQPNHSWEHMTDNGYIRNHDPTGDTLYVVDICVHPAYRKWGLGKWLMQTMYEVVVHQRLDRLVGGGRMPGYHHYANQMTAEQYLQAVMKGELNDPVVTFLLRCGRSPFELVPHYLQDEQSCHYAVLMEWKNPFIGGARRHYGI